MQILLSEAMRVQQELKMFDFGDGFVSIYGKSYCIDDYGTVVPTASRIKAAIEYALDYGTTLKLF